MRRSIVGMASVLALVAGAGLSAQRTAPSRFSALAWRPIGPFGGGVVAGVAGVAGQPGTYVVSTPAGAFRTYNAAATWQPETAAAAPPPLERTWTDPSNPARIARAEVGGISVSLDGGATWTPHHDLPIAAIVRVATNPASPGWIFATAADGHTTALPIRASVTGVPPSAPAVPPAGVSAGDRPQTVGGEAARCVRVDAVASALRFACVAGGVLVSFDAGAQWSPLTLNLPRVAVTDLAIHGDDLIAATDGRSVWVLDDIAPLRQIAEGTATGDVTLFRPAAATLDASGRPAVPVVYLDYYLAADSVTPVTLDLVDAAGERVYSRTSAASASTDPWAPVRAPLSTRAGGHRIAWNLRLDPPPAPSNRYRQLAPHLFLGDDEQPLAPEGPVVRPGTYQVRLTVGTRTVTQPCVVRPASTSRTSSGVADGRFDLARKVYDGLRAAHDGYLRLARVRVAVKALTTSTDPEVAQAAADFGARLADLDGSDWRFVLPDVDDETDYDDKDVDEPPPPPTAVALTKDYDDPTTIIGRPFENASHSPAFSLVADAMTSLLARVEAGPLAPPAALAADVGESDQELAAVQSAWDAVVATDLPAFNAVLVAHHLPPIPRPDGRRP